MTTRVYFGDKLVEGVSSVNLVASEPVEANSANINQAFVGTTMQGTCSGDWGTPPLLTADARLGRSPAPNPSPLTGIDIQVTDGTNANWKHEVCKEFHVLTDELLACSDEDNIVGVCDRCGVRVFVPRIPGAFSFEKAGTILGRAMSLAEDDEDEAVGELVLEIEALQQAIDRDIRKYKRAMEVLQIARGMARKQLLKVAEPIE